MMHADWRADSETGTLLARGRGSRSMTDGRKLLLAMSLGSLGIASGCKDPLPEGPVDLTSPPRCTYRSDPSISDPAAGCGVANPPTGVLDLAPLSNGTPKGILVVPPSAGTTPLPLIWVFHGAYATPQDIRDTFQLEPAVDGGAIIAYLRAGRGTWDVGSGSTDVLAVLTITEQLAQQYCIDRDRVFAAGFSAGAVFTLDLECLNPKTFRAITAVAGTEDRFDTRCCTGKESALLIHGDTDDTIGIAGSIAAVDRIGAFDGCAPASVPLDGHCVEYPGCSDGKALAFCRHPDGHVVPPWAAQEAWTFFQRFE